MDVREYIDRNAPGFLAALPFDEQAWLAEAGHSGAASGEAGYSMLERIWTRPTAEINGMWGGHTGPGGKTIAR